LTIIFRTDHTPTIDSMNTTVRCRPSWIARP